jgi:hypothetical protein
VVDGAQLTLPEVHEHLTALEVAKFKWPERLEHLPEIPRTPVGKTDKKGLAADIARKVGSSGVSTKRAASATIGSGHSWTGIGSGHFGSVASRRSRMQWAIAARFAKSGCRCGPASVVRCS